VRVLSVTTSRRTELVDITEQDGEAVARRGGSLVSVFAPHTTADVLLQAAGEGSSAVARDIAAALERLAGEGWPWQHLLEGDRNPWAHVRAALTASPVSIPLADRELVLGGRQAVFLAEFDGPRERVVYVSVAG
jgi:secondary thiamine-phosphate synthase enzyme